MITFLRENFRWIAGGFLLTYFSSIGQTFFISASVGEWRSMFDLSHGQFGQLYMLATLASAMVLPFAGKIVDIMPEHRVIALVAPALAAAALLAAHAPSIPVLILAIFLLRLLGQGMMTHIALTATGRWFAAQRGRAVSLVVLGHQGGEATLPLMFASLASLVSFQAGWTGAALLVLVVALPLGVWAYRTPRSPRGVVMDHPQSTRQWTRPEVIRDPVFWVLLTGVLAPAFIGTTIFFHQDYLTTLRGWPPLLFAQGLTLMAATTVAFALINGALIDRFGAVAVLPFFLLPLSIACLTAGLAVETWTVVVFMMLLGMSYGISSTLFGALWPEIYGTKHLGAVRSLVVSAMVLATAVGPGLTGTLIDMGLPLPDQLLAMSAYCLAISAVLALCAQVLRRRFHSQSS